MLFAPLCGALAYLGIIGQFENAAWELGFFSLILIAWFFALTIELVLGLPIGLIVARLLRERNRESRIAYTGLGVAAAAVLPAAFSWWHLVAPAAITGLLLGLGYWQFEAMPRLQNA